LNNSDSVSGRIFSIFHEYCHLTTDNAGICDMQHRRRARDEIDHTEIFCNSFAGSLLVPKTQFMKSIKSKDAFDNFYELKSFYETQSYKFKVSREVILRKLLIFDLIDEDTYKQHVEILHDEAIKQKERQREKLKEEEFHGFAQFKMCIRDNGVRFVSLVLNAYREDKISYTDISDYLKVRTKHIPKIEKRINEIMFK